MNRLPTPHLPGLLAALISILAAPILAAQDADPLAQAPPISTPLENSAARSRLQGEYILLIGGPALRSWENFRVSYQQHDRWWANFVAASNARTRQLIEAGVPPASITWLAFRPGYVRRAAEEGKPLLTWIPALPAKRGANFRWFSTQDELIAYLNRGNNRSSNRIASLDFFGHSNKYCYLFDYSSEIAGASTVWLHERDLRKINRSAFHRQAFCKSWGCHTAESMSRKWKSTVGVPLWGALGKTDYVPTGRGQLPELSTAAGAWRR